LEKKVIQPDFRRTPYIYTTLRPPIEEHKEIRSFTVLCPINCFDSRGRVEKELRLLKRAVKIPVAWAAKAGFNHFMESIKRENDQQLLALIEKGLIESAGPQDGE